MASSEEILSSIAAIDNLISEAKEKIELNVQADYDSDYNYHKEMREELRTRTKAVTQILQNYSTQQEERYNYKKDKKEVLLNVLIFILVVLTIGLILWIGLFFGLGLTDKESIIGIITSVVAYLGALLSILTVIVKYLFPENEDKYFNELVSSIIKNDTEMTKNEIDYQLNKTSKEKRF